MKKTFCILIILLKSVTTYAGGNEEYCEPTVKTVEKRVYVDRTVKEVVVKEVKKTNRLSVLLGQGPSDNLEVRTTSPITTQVTRPNENLIGIQYQKDIDNLTLGVVGLSNETLLLSVGVNW